MILVSIPIGFSSSLQRGEVEFYQVGRHGFNPYRVFKFVATRFGIDITILQYLVSIPIGFSSSLQPLILQRYLGNCFGGFNPYRVFKFVATNNDLFCVPKSPTVSIPIGFSSSLQPRRSNIK